LIAGDFSTYYVLFNLEMQLLLTFAVWLGVRTADRLRPGCGESALAWTLAAVAALGVVTVRRFDATLSLAIAAAFCALLMRRPAVSGAAWAAGVAIKGSPLVLGPLALIWHLVERDFGALARATGAAALVLVASGLILVAVAGPNWSDPFVYHALRPLQIESFYGGLLIAARLFDPAISSTSYSFGSQNVVSAYEPALRAVAALAPFLALAGVYVWTFVALRRAKDREARFSVLLAAACAALVAFATLGKVFSPQYLTWLIPLGPLTALSAGPTAGRWMIIAFALTQYEYPFLYSTLGTVIEPSFGFVVLARDLLLWTWVLLLLRKPRDVQFRGEFS
jgi:hypothetical protein